MTTPLEQQLAVQAEQALAAHGLVLVQARLAGSGKYLTLQVLAEKPNGASPAIEECSRASRTLGAQLDVLDLIKGRYMLEVSSAGIDRPLTKPADYQRFVGRHAKLTFEAKQSINGQDVGSAAGYLIAANDEAITFAPQDAKAHIDIAYADIRHAHLAPNAAEMALFMKKQPLPGEVYNPRAEDDSEELNS